MKKTKIRKILDRRGLSLQTGADLLGVSRRTMAYYSSGKIKIPDDKLDILLNAET